MKIFVVAALALVSSSIAAPTTDKSLAVRESHILDAGARQGAFNAVSVDLEGLVDDPEAQKATTNVKRSKPGKKNKKKALTKTSMVSRKKGSKKSYKKHPKRLIKLKVTTTGFKSGQDIVDNLDSTLDQITDHTDNIDTILAQVEAGKLSEKQGTSDTQKEMSNIRTILSGPLSRLSATHNIKTLNLTDDQRTSIVALIDDILTELLRTIEGVLRTLGPSLSMNASMNPMMNVLTSFLGSLAMADKILAIQLRELVSLIIKDQAADNNGSGLTLLLSGFENSLLRLHGILNASDKSD